MEELRITHGTTLRPRINCLIIGIILDIGNRAIIQRLSRSTHTSLITCLLNLIQVLLSTFNLFIRLLRLIIARSCFSIDLSIFFRILSHTSIDVVLMLRLNAIESIGDDIVMNMLLGILLTSTETTKHHSTCDDSRTNGRVAVFAALKGGDTE